MKELAGGLESGFFVQSNRSIGNLKKRNKYKEKNEALKKSDRKKLKAKGINACENE